MSLKEPSTSKSREIQNTGLKKKERRKLLNKELTTNLDVAKISDRKAALIHTSTLNRLGCDPTKLNIHFSSKHCQHI